jgi:hypothetical protein
MKIKFDAKLKWDITETKFLKERNLALGGLVQKYIDSTVLRLCEPYIPFRTGMLTRSGQVHTQIGSGLVIYNTPYATKMYYNPQYNFNLSFHPLAGAFWFARMKADHSQEILEGAKKIAGAK